MAAVQAIAFRRGVAPAAVRAEWTRSRERGRSVGVVDRATRPLSRRSVLLGGSAAAAWLALDGNRLEAAQAPPAPRKAPPVKPQATVAIVGAGLAGLTAALTL